MFHVDQTGRLSAFSMICYILLCFLVVFDHSVLCCLRCDKESDKRLKNFRNFLADQYEDLSEYSKTNAHMTSLFNAALDPFTGRKIDKLALSQMAAEFKKAVESMENSGVLGYLLYRTIEVRFAKLKTKFSDILSQFLSQRLCPNNIGDKKCGLMEQTLIDCESCDEEKISCVGGHGQCKEKVTKCPLCTCNEEDTNCQDIRKGRSCTPCEGYQPCLNEVLHCGDRYTEVVQDEDLMFDCHLLWHAKVEETLEYVFKMIGQKRNRLLKVTDDPLLVKKNLGYHDTGNYSCTAQFKSGIPVSTIIFKVHVIPKQGGEPPPKARPTLPPLTMGPAATTPVYINKEEIYILISVVIAVICSLLILTIIGFLCIRRRRTKRQVGVV